MISHGPCLHLISPVQLNFSAHLCSRLSAVGARTLGACCVPFFEVSFRLVPRTDCTRRIHALLAAVWPAKSLEASIFLLSSGAQSFAQAHSLLHPEIARIVCSAVANGSAMIFKRSLLVYDFEMCGFTSVTGLSDRSVASVGTETWRSD